MGLILAYEASRLARNDADWYTLLDLAALAGALIGDADGIYDPRAHNDRLLLGLRGMLGEAELHLLRLRLDAGLQRQIERGALRHPLPTGLVRLPDGRAVKDPDQAVQHALELVFDRFVQLGSCARVLRSLQRDQLLLPRQAAQPAAGSAAAAAAAAHSWRDCRPDGLAHADRWDGLGHPGQSGLRWRLRAWPALASPPLHWIRRCPHRRRSVGGMPERSSTRGPILPT